jgi:antitoxin (DNA-binding transcriptional repressor) of toxin-antitoxin stability system
MPTATVEEVQARLPELLGQLDVGDELTIVSNGKPVARLLPAAPPSGVPALGRGKGKLTVHTDDDEHLIDFAGHLPPELDRRILELGERKDTLTADERAELLAWVAFTQARSIEAAEARVTVRRLANVFPELTDQP